MPDSRSAPPDDNALETDSAAGEQPRIGPFHSWQVFLATGFGLGMLSPIAPGTVGALMGIPLAMLLGLLPEWGILGVGLQIGIILLLVLVGIPVCTSAQRSLRKKDPSEVIWDELTTVPIVFLFLPGSLLLNPGALLIGFALHRLFDITKPPPCRYLERWPAGRGIMFDDVAAAVYGCMVMQVLLLFGLW